MTTLVVQIPCFNEGEYIGNIFKDIPQKINGVDVIEILVVDDCSIDKTVEVAREHNIKHIISLPRHLGLGGVFRVGLKYACSIGADIIVNFDADNQYKGSEIGNIIKPILDLRADMVIGERQFSRIKGYPFYKLISQNIGNFLVSKSFHAPIRDVTSGFRALTRDTAYAFINNLRNDYTYTLESVGVLLKKKKLISSVPITINYPTRKSRLIKNKLFYTADFFRTLWRTSHYSSKDL